MSLDGLVLMFVRQLCVRLEALPYLLIGVRLRLESCLVCVVPALFVRV